MGSRALFNFFKKNNAKKLVDEELNYKLYERVKKEIESGIKNDGVWTKAYADAKGNLQKTKAIYIKLMVERLRLLDEQEEKKKKEVLEQEAEERAIKIKEHEEEQKRIKDIEFGEAMSRWLFIIGCILLACFTIYCVVEIHSYYTDPINNS